jgi:hypothetical protein
MSVITMHFTIRFTVEKQGFMGRTPSVRPAKKDFKKCQPTGRCLRAPTAKPRPDSMPPHGMAVRDAGTE